MYKIERLNYILEMLTSEGKVDIKRLENELNVSGMTIRRDLVDLEKKNKIIRTHGGAILTDSFVKEVAHNYKSTVKLPEKRKIAKEAYKQIKEGDVVFLDAGTTTLELAKLIKKEKNLTILSNDIKILNELIDSKGTVIATGGTVQAEVGSMFGEHAKNLIQKISIDILFLGTHAVDLSRGISTTSFEKAALKQLMINSSKEVWLLTDSSKFEKKSFVEVCKLNEITGIYTNKEKLPPNIKEYEVETFIHKV